MFEYLIILSIVLFFVFKTSILDGFPSSKGGFFWYCFFGFLILLIGFRHEVGADWDIYLLELESFKNESLASISFSRDPAYQFLNWLGSNFFGGIYFVNFICAIIFCYGLSVFCLTQFRPWLALLVAVPYLVIVVAMGYSRQAVAISLIMIAITKIDNNIFYFYFFVFIGALFHKSALLMLPFGMFVSNNKFFSNFLISIFLVILLSSVLVIEQLEFIERTYLQSELESSGSIFRLAMTLLPTFIFIFYNKKFLLLRGSLRFYKSMAFSSFLLIILFFVSPSSTLVDRVALYWFPLQIITIAGVPDALGVPFRRNLFWVFLICFYCTAVLLIWFSFGSYASFWLPYKSLINFYI